MGLLVSGCGDSTRAPIYFTNTQGREAWSGLSEDELRSDVFTLRQLFRFCKEEGYRVGWNMHRSTEQGTSWCPFDKAFLDGVPYYLWTQAAIEASLDCALGECRAPCADAHRCTDQLETFDEEFP